MIIRRSRDEIRSSVGCESLLVCFLKQLNKKFTVHEKEVFSDTAKKGVLLVFSFSDR
jgi:hypothetical protein